MTDFAALRLTAQQHRADLAAADHELLAARSDLVVARSAWQTQPTAENLAARDAAETKVGTLEGARSRTRDLLDTQLGQIVAASQGAAAIDGVDADLPIALLPVRLETRFADTPAGVALKVRIYPDTAHIDDHEPALTDDEAAAGTRYWTALGAGTPEPEAWAALAAVAGPHRGLWLRQATEPGAPESARRAPGTSRPSVARGLPDYFVVRVRTGGQTLIVTGSPLPDVVQVGIDMSATTSTANLDGEILVLDEGMRWMTEYDRAEATGMAVTVALPPGTMLVDDVTVIGVAVSLPAEDADQLVDALVGSHHTSDGAGFITPGTPTNNLADSASGYTDRPDPARLDPATLPAVGDDANAAVLARALGMDMGGLATLGGAADTEDRDQKTMQQGMFEATWGPYLRQQAQPGFPPKMLPQVIQYLLAHLRPGGPLPALRLGAQPYGILPIQPAGWQPSADDAGFVGWLGGFLTRIRPLWRAGVPDIPPGLALYSHEAVSTAVRIRTTNASYASPIFPGLDMSEDAVQERRLATELGIGDVLPTVLSNRYRSDPARLWLPMSDDDDLAFDVFDPQPKNATSILGLLLRNAALQVTSEAASEYWQRLQVDLDQEFVGYLARPPATAVFPEAAGIAVSTTMAFAVQRDPSLTELLGSAGRDATGANVVIGDALRADDRVDAVTAVARYLSSDAMVLFREALRLLPAIPADRRGRLAGGVLDSVSHRYDAWVTSLASRRLGQLRAARPTGLQLGAWGYVSGIRRRTETPVADRPDLPAGTRRDQANRGFVVTPSLRQATVAGIVRAAWAAHGGDPQRSAAPFATDLHSRRVRRALGLTAGMRNGQQLGAMLGYQLERHLHDVSGGGDGLEFDWAIFEFRRRFPLRVSTGENTATQSERLVVDGWQVARSELDAPGSPSAAVGAGRTPAERAAIQQGVDDLVASLDALTDLGLAEGVFQLVGRNFERASAATDMIGRVAVPPDGFEVAATPRGGTGIDQRLVLAFPAADRPAGWAADTPRAQLAPAADAFVASRLCPASGVIVRLIDENGGEAGRSDLGTLGLAALDLAADAASSGAEPFPLLLDLARRATGVTGRCSIGLDVSDDPLGNDTQLVDLLQHAAAWHLALAGRPPLGPASFVHRGAMNGPAGNPDALTAVQAMAAGLQAATDETLPFWGLHAPNGTAGPLVASRAQDVAAATDPVVAARALFGTDAVLTGPTVVPDDVGTSLADQAGLGADAPGVVAGWLIDTARVRTPARQLDEALLADDLAGLPAVPLAAAQSPAAPYTLPPDSPESRRWVGGVHPAGLGKAPVLSVVVIGDTAGASLTGLELDSWAEVVPDRAGAGAAAANLSAPDARPPNTILLAVPAVAGAPWTTAGLFSVVDEAIDLAGCRLVDLDATKRIPTLLPACFIADFAEPTKWSDVIAQLPFQSVRYVSGAAHE